MAHIRLAHNAWLVGVEVEVGIEVRNCEEKMRKCGEKKVARFAPHGSYFDQPRGPTSIRISSHM